ncbi:MAG: EF-hand domain-containing protein, partial [Bacteroidota bacterium]
MKNTFKISALVLAMTFFANYTNAQQQGRGRQMISFSTLDANKDGKVTESEFNTARENQMEKTNGRGMRIQNISFADIDIDSNNEVSQEEFSKFSPNRQGRGQGRNQGRRNGRGNGQGNGQGRQNAMAQNQPSFESYDIDKDGFVSE